jgi:hypothetical protein
LCELLLFHRLPGSGFSFVEHAATGSKIRELGEKRHSLFIQQNSHEQARLLRTLVSNCTFDRGTLSVSYVKPFDLLVEGNESGNWLGVRDGIRNWLLTAA